MSIRKELCDKTVAFLKEEGMAGIDYDKMAEIFRESGIEEIKNLSIVMEKLAQDERSHKIVFDKIARIVCPIS